jgi:hypothetical protein
VTENSGDSPAFTVLAGNPTPEELAAVTAVMTAMADELDHRRMPTGKAGAGAWERSVRRLRTQIIPGPGAWNGEKL